MKYKHTLLFITSLLMAILIALPSSGYAKEKENRSDDKKNNEKVRVVKIDDRDREDNDRDDDDDDKKDSRKNDARDDDKDDDDDDDDGDRDNSRQKCFRAWGHLISFGWLKKNNAPEISDDCRMPFGIGKKFRGNNASTTPDVVAPVISAISFRPAKTQAEVRWKTNERADSTVFWSTSLPVSIATSSTHMVSKRNLTKEHQVVIKGLTATTTYYVVVRSRDAAGNTTLSEAKSFITKGVSADRSLPIISNVVTRSATTTIRVGWMTNEQTTGRVYYSTTLPVVANTSGQFVNTASTSRSQFVEITGLSANTTYYLVIEATDLAGNVSTSATFTARTGGQTIPPADTTAPVITASNINIGTTTAVVNWNTNEVTTSKLYYGTSNPLDVYATSTLSAIVTTSLAAHSVFLSGLASSTPYYVIIISTDAAGNTSTSSQSSFITN